MKRNCTPNNIHIINIHIHTIIYTKNNYIGACFKVLNSEVVCSRVVSKEQSMGQQKILLHIQLSLCSSNPDFLSDSAQSALKLRIYFSTSYFSVPLCMQYNGNYYQLENFSFPQLHKTLRFIFHFWFSLSYTKYFSAVYTKVLHGTNLLTESTCFGVTYDDRVLYLCRYQNFLNNYWRNLACE